MADTTAYFTPDCDWQFPRSSAKGCARTSTNYFTLPARNVIKSIGIYSWGGGSDWYFRGAASGAIYWFDASSATIDPGTTFSIPAGAAALVLFATTDGQNASYGNRHVAFTDAYYYPSYGASNPVGLLAAGDTPLYLYFHGLGVKTIMNATQISNIHQNYFTVSRCDYYSGQTPSGLSPKAARPMIAITYGPARSPNLPPDVAVQRTRNMVNVTWSGEVAGAGNEITGYKIIRNTSASESGAVTLESNTEINPYSDKPPTREQFYYYGVSALSPDPEYSSTYGWSDAIKIPNTPQVAVGSEITKTNMDALYDYINITDGSLSKVTVGNTILQNPTATTYSKNAASTPARAAKITAAWYNTSDL